MNESMMYAEVVSKITETEFKELWTNAYPNDIIHIPYYWNEFSHLNTVARYNYLEGHRRLNKFVWKKVKDCLKNFSNK